MIGPSTVSQRRTCLCVCCFNSGKAGWMLMEAGGWGGEMQGSHGSGQLGVRVVLTSASDWYSTAASITLSQASAVWS